MESKQILLPDIFRADCLSRQVLHLIADEWTPLVIYALAEGTMRFGHLLKRINGISAKMLTQTLRALERNGLVQRVVYARIPPTVEYSLTPLGLTLNESLRALKEWAYEHLREVAQACALYDALDHTSVQAETASLVQQREIPS